MTDNYDLENLQQVWERVTSSGAEDTKSGDLTAMRKLMDMEATISAVYVRAAKESKGAICRFMYDGAAEGRSHIKKLRTVHFILTGDTYAPEVQRPQDDRLIETLRLIYISEERLLDAYKKEWNNTKDSRLSRLYSEFADEKSRRLTAAENIISDILY